MRYTGTIHFNHQGDKAVAMTYESDARVLMGKLLKEARHNDKFVLVARKTLSNGVRIEVGKHGDILRSTIYVPSIISDEQDLITEICTGFIVVLTSLADKPWKTSSGEQVAEYPGSGSWGLSLKSLGLEPGRDKDVPEDWIYDATGLFRSSYTWDQDEYSPPDKNGWIKRDVSFINNAMDICHADRWEQSSGIFGDHGARIWKYDEDFSPPFVVYPGWEGLLSEVSNSKANSEQDEIWNNYDFDVDFGFKFWTAREWFVSTENYFVCASDVLYAGEDGLAVESGEILLGPTNPFESWPEGKESVAPTPHSHGQVSFALIPSEMSVYADDALGTYHVDQVEPMGYDTTKYNANGDPVSQELPGAGETFVFYDQRLEQQYMEYRKTTMPTVVKSGDYIIDTNPVWLDFNRTTEEKALGEKVFVQITLFGLRYASNKLEFTITSGEEMSKFLIKVNTSVTIKRKDIASLYKFFVQDSPQE